VKEEQAEEEGGWQPGVEQVNKYTREKKVRCFQVSSGETKTKPFLNG